MGTARMPKAFAHYPRPGFFRGIGLTRWTMETPQSGVAEVPAAGGQQQPSSTGQEPAPEGSSPKPESTNVTVPLHVVERVRQDLSAEKAARAELETKLREFTLSQQLGGGAQQRAPANNPPPQAPAEPEFEDPLADMGDDDLVEAKHVRKAIQAIRNAKTPRQQDAGTAQLAETVARLQLQMQDPQYETTIKTYLPEMLNANPMWSEMIKTAPNPLMAAHAIAKSSPKYIEAQAAATAAGTAKETEAPPDILADLSRIIDNATRPGNPGSVGGGAGGISGHDRFRTMSDADLDKEIQRVLSGAPR